MCWRTIIETLAYGRVPKPLHFLIGLLVSLLPACATGTLSSFLRVRKLAEVIHIHVVMISPI